MAVAGDAGGTTRKGSARKLALGASIVAQSSKGRPTLITFIACGAPPAAASMRHDPSASQAQAVRAWLPATMGQRNQRSEHEKAASGTVNSSAQRECTLRRAAVRCCLTAGFDLADSERSHRNGGRCILLARRSIKLHIDKMDTVQLWKAHHLQYVLRQTGPDSHSIPMFALHPEEVVVPKNAATREMNSGRMIPTPSLRILQEG